MRILSIETSCDETAIAIIDVEGSSPDLKFTVLANQVHSQIDLHKQYGGVFPMMAKREHARTLVPLLKSALREAGIYKEGSRHVVESPLRNEFKQMLEREPEMYAQFINDIPQLSPPQIDLIAVTTGPGLEPALWVGINFAKAISLVWKTPLMPINHMEGHLLSPLLKRTETGFSMNIPTLPLLGLLVSGGHTEIVLMRDWGIYEVVGQTLDDAAGEAFDKVARMLGLPYPGGPEISKLAKRGTAGNFNFPRPMLHTKNNDFSFSGLKTSVLYKIKELPNITDEQKADIAYDFQEACVEVLTVKTLNAIKEYSAQSVVVGGGVSANARLKEVLTERVTRDEQILVYFPEPAEATDNALMIGVAAAVKFPSAIPALEKILANGNWKISEK